MAQFAYKARRRSGEMVQGTIDVPDKTAALMHIQRLGLFPIAVDQSREKTSGKPKKARRRRPRESATESSLLPQFIKDAMSQQKKPKMVELARYTLQLANLLKSGMPLTVALNSMTHLESKGVPSSVSEQLKQDVMEGRNLSDSMARQPIYFSDLYVNMVRAGEQSGALEDVLRRLASHFERFAEVSQRFKSALIYPSVVITVVILVMFFFMTYMLPKFMEIFTGLNVPLPMSTQILIGISNFFENYWWMVASMMLVFFVLFKRYQSSDSGRRSIDSFKLKAPLFGQVFRLSVFGQFARTLATLLQNGVPVLTALKITEEILTNVIVKDAIALTREAVTDGKTIAQPLARSKIFPQLMLDLLKIGEETGDVAGALNNVADTYENELDVALRIMTSLIEPILTIVMAVLVGFLLIGVLSAMFSITSTIGRG